MIEAQDIAEMARHIASRVRRTPVLDVDVPGCDLPVTLKLEFLQHTASFKPRGAFANLIGRDLPKAGVAAASGGNHGAAVAYAAWRLGIKAHEQRRRDGTANERFGNVHNGAPWATAAGTGVTLTCDPGSRRY